MITARSVMTKDVVTISPQSSIQEAARLMGTRGVRSLVAVEGSMPVAVVTANNVIDGIVSEKSKVREIMGANIEIVSPSTHFSQIIRILKDKKITRFPVVENQSLIGIITETDIVEATRDFTRFHLLMQDIILITFGLTTLFFMYYFTSTKALFF